MKAYYSKPKRANKRVSATDLVEGVLSAVRSLRSNLTVEIADKADKSREYRVELPLEGGAVPSFAWDDCLDDVRNKEAHQTADHEAQLAHIAVEKAKALQRIQAESLQKRQQIEIEALQRKQQIEAETRLMLEALELQHQRTAQAAADKHQSKLEWFSQNRETIIALRDSMQLGDVPQPEEEDEESLPLLPPAEPENPRPATSVFDFTEEPEVVGLVNDDLSSEQEDEDEDEEEEENSFVVPDDAILSEVEEEEPMVVEISSQEEEPAKKSKGVRRSSRKRKQTQHLILEEQADDLGEEIELDEYVGQHIDEHMRDDFTHLFAAKAGELTGNGADLVNLWRQHSFFRTAYEKYLKWCWCCGQEAPSEIFTFAQLENMISNLADIKLPVPSVQPVLYKREGTCAACRLQRYLSHGLNDAWAPKLIMGCDCAAKIQEVCQFARLLREVITNLRAEPSKANSLAREHWPRFRECFLRVEALRESMSLKYPQKE